MAKHSYKTHHNFTLEKPQPYKIGPEGSDRSSAMTPTNPGPSLTQNPKTGGRMNGPGPAFKDSLRS